MPQSTDKIPLLSVSELVQRLSTITRNETCALAFDGDGTLWSGDVSDDVFFQAVLSEWFLENAKESLLNVLTAYNESTEGSLGTMARRLHDAHAYGRVPEQTLFETMTYVYAGRSAAELTEYAAHVLAQKRIHERIRFGIRPLLDWARDAGHHCYLVSASPLPIVAVPAKVLGFDEQHIIASCATDNAGQIRDQITAPIPYLEQKVVQLQHRSSARRLLAAFGDSPFDINLLSAAEVAVLVEPKPALLEALRTWPNITAVRWLVNQ